MYFDVNDATSREYNIISCDQYIRYNNDFSIKLCNGVMNI